MKGGMHARRGRLLDNEIDGHLFDCLSIRDRAKIRQLVRDRDAARRALQMKKGRRAHEGGE